MCIVQPKSNGNTIFIGKHLKKGKRCLPLKESVIRITNSLRALRPKEMGCGCV
jgi:hypothetical protein